MRIDIQEILRPVTVITRLWAGHVVLRIPDVAHRRRDPDCGHAEIREVAALQREFEPAQVAAVILVDVVSATPSKIAGIAPGGDVVLRIAVVEAIGHREVDYVLIPRT